MLGRPARDPAPGSWMGRLRSDRRISVLPEDWSRANWALRLARDFNAYYLHIPLDDNLIRGLSPDSRHVAYIKSLISTDEAKIFLSVIGTGVDFEPFVNDEDSLKQLAKLLADICRRYELDGIDLDWEFLSAPGPEELQKLKALASELKILMPEDSTLSAAVSRWRLPDEEFFSIVDKVHLMAYDGYGKHATYESAVADSDILLSRYGVSPEKLILGLPFYGRIFSPEAADYWKGTMNYRRIIETFQPEFTADDAGGYYYNGPETIVQKTSWAVDRRLGGVFVWEPFYDADGPQSLSGALRDTIEYR